MHAVLPDDGWCFAKYSGYKYILRVPVVLTRQVDML